MKAKRRRKKGGEKGTVRTPLPLVTSCEGCGVCCTEQAGLPVGWYLGVHPLGDKAALPPELLAELEALLEEWRRGHFPDDGTPCVWYDVEKKQCKHYEQRPQICKDLEVGSDSCLRWRKIKGIDPTTRWVVRAGKTVREVR